MNDRRGRQPHFIHHIDENNPQFQYNNQQQQQYATTHPPTQPNAVYYTYQHPSPAQRGQQRLQSSLRQQTQQYYPPPQRYHYPPPQHRYATPSPVRVPNRRHQQYDNTTLLHQQLELEAAFSYITTLEQQLETANSEVSRLKAECNTKDGLIIYLEEKLLEAESSAVNRHCLHYNPQTDTVLDISNLGEEIIRQYVQQHQNTYTYCSGGLSNLHTHINNVKLSLQANIDPSKPNSKCILCDSRKAKGLEIFLKMCSDCYKTQVTKRLTYEEIFAKEIMHAFPDFKVKENLPFPTTNYEEICIGLQKKL